MHVVLASNPKGGYLGWLSSGRCPDTNPMIDFRNPKIIIFKKIKLSLFWPYPDTYPLDNHPRKKYP